MTFIPPESDYVRWHQRSGLCEHVGPDGLLRTLGIGYSGHGVGLNDPSSDAIPNIGPLPRGWWRALSMRDGGMLGPDVIPLIPCEGTVTHARSGFYSHGNVRGGGFSASHGCLVLPRDARLAWGDLIEQGQVFLLVVAE